MVLLGLAWLPRGLQAAAGLSLPAIRGIRRDAVTLTHCSVRERTPCLIAPHMGPRIGIITHAYAAGYAP